MNTETANSESTPENGPSNENDVAAEIQGESHGTASAAQATRARIQIGSQRDAADVLLTPTLPNAVQQAKQRPTANVEPRAASAANVEQPAASIVGEVQQKDATAECVEQGSVPVVSVAEGIAPAMIVQGTPAPVEEMTPLANSLEGLGDDLDSEIEAAISGVSMDAVLGGIVEGEQELEFNSRLKATVTKIHGEHVFVSLKGRFEGVMPMTQFKKPPAEGMMLEVVVKNRNDDDGLYEVGIPGSIAAVGDWEDLTEGEIVEVRVSGANTGGLEVQVNNIRGFIPASQIERFRVENLGDYVNQKLQCLVTEVNEQKGKLVLSRRAILERENAEKRKLLLASLAVGDEHQGTITKLMDFGAFVDIGGVEGLVHVSKLSWDRVTHPRDVVSEGEKVTVKIERVNPDTGKISLSIRDTLEDPWDQIESKYAVSTTVKGTVTRITDFGAFVKLEPGIEGLVHISEIAHHRVVRVGNHVNRGDEVEVKIMSIDSEKQKIGLSIKETQAVPVKEAKVTEEIDEPIREMAVRASHGTLRGGTDRKSGGEGVGLNW